jgi:hypothetical protein
MKLVADYPARPDLVRRMAKLAQEETQHFLTPHPRGAAAEVRCRDPRWRVGLFRQRRAPSQRNHDDRDLAVPMQYGSAGGTTGVAAPETERRLP